MSSHLYFNPLAVNKKLTTVETMKIVKFAGLLFLASITFGAMACKDAVVLVHGNTASPSSWDNTYNLLLNNGYSSGEIFRPDWGSKSCAGCNNHYGSDKPLFAMPVKMRWQPPVPVTSI